MRARAALLTLLLLGAGLSGCVADEDTGEAGSEAVESAGDEANRTQPSPSTGETVAADEEDGMQLATYEDLDETVVNRVTENGTFQAHEACMLGGCVTGDATRRVDLPVPGPDGTPIHVLIDLSTEGGTPFLWLDAGDATVYSMDREVSEEGSHQSIEAVVLPGEETLQAVITWFGFPPATETQYELEARMMAHHDIAFSGVAVSVPLEPGQQVRLENARNEDPISFVGYDPSGVEQTRQSSDGSVIETTLPDDAPAGEHIILVPPGQPDVHISTNGTEATMTPVEYNFEMGEAHEVTSGQPVEWTFETSSAPLAVGLWIRNEDVTSFRAGEYSGAIDSPEGTVLEIQQGCGPFVCFSGGTFTLFYGSQVADPKLTPGTYAATYEQQVANGASVGHYVVSFDI